MFSLSLTFLKTTQNQKFKSTLTAHLLAKLTSHQAQLIHSGCKNVFLGLCVKKRKGEITKAVSIYWCLILNFAAYRTIFSKMSFLKLTCLYYIFNQGSQIRVQNFIK